MFRGSMVALATPMDAEGDVDYECLTRLVDYHLANKTDGLIVAGTTGESGTLTHEEHHHMVQYVVREVAGRIPVVAGTGATATSVAIKLTQTAMEAGADACLINAPPYVKPTQEGLFRHYKAISEAVAIPLILYNVPSRTACDILPETVARLADFPNIVGIKEATGKLQRLLDLRSLCDGKLDIYSGDDATACQFMLNGAKGVISVTANIAPRLMHDMVAAIFAGNEVLAEEINAKLNGLHQKLFVESNPIPLKWAMMKMGLISSGIRLPLTPLTEKYYPEVLAAMEQAGIVFNQ
ncbi:MAG: 4-hydroxy-tetrahydrodipicolinate synthase [Gammaproteobacteria bacterium]|nr:4-hydroxy-tetrahydrodipicolinate synthase [Gammaproteobacteria bacterium]